MLNFTFDGIRRDWVRVLFKQPDRVAPIDWQLSTVPRRPGAILQNKQVAARSIPMTIDIEATSKDVLLRRIEELAAWLIKDEPKPLIFDDDPDRTYYALFNGSFDTRELALYGQVSFTFICPDPFKYGPEQNAVLNTDTGSIINIAGNEDTKPIITLTATQPSTMAMVANDRGDYMMIGQPLDVEKTPFRPEDRIFTDDMNAIGGWVAANSGDVDHLIAGTMESVSGAFKATSYGTGTGYHGPAVKKSLSEPLTDFKMDATVEMMNTADPNMIGNVEVYMLDANGICIARIGLRDSTAAQSVVYGQARAGQKTNSKTLINEYGANPGSWNNFHGLLRIQRKNNKWVAYIAKVNRQTGEHHTRRFFDDFEDVAGTFSAPISQIVVAIQQYKDFPVPDMQVNQIIVNRLNEQEGIPYIVYAGDIITFDHRGKGKILINGEDAKSLKNFGAYPFPLKPQTNTLAVIPEGTFTGTISWRDTFK